MLPGQGVKANGTFRFKNVPEGSYRAIVVPRGANFFLKSVRCGTLTVTDNGFTVQAGSEATLELTVSNRAAKLDGVVLNANSLPAVGAAVVLIPDPPHRDIKYRYMAATTDQNGAFSITGITPGDYKIFSWDSLNEADEEYGEDWYDAEWLKPYEGKGESVHLEEADRKSLNLKVIPSGGESSAAN